MTNEEETELVRKLREHTGIGIMFCKKALIEAEWNFEKAIDVAIRMNRQSTILSKVVRKIIFLDIDGVLCIPASRWNYFDFDCYTKLKYIVEQTNSHIVISSSWRIGKHLDVLKNIFKKNGDECDVIYKDPHYFGPYVDFDVERIIDKTSSRSNRGDEISHWINEHKESVEKYIVIDDETYDLGDHLEYVVKTKMDIGLTDEDVEKAIKMLGGN